MVVATTSNSLPEICGTMDWRDQTAMPGCINVIAPSTCRRGSLQPDQGMKTCACHPPEETPEAAELARPAPADEAAAAEVVACGQHTLGFSSEVILQQNI